VSTARPSHAHAAPSARLDADDILRANVFGLDVAAVLLPNEMLTEDRVRRMNALWDLLGEREALVIAVTPGANV